MRKFILFFLLLPAVSMAQPSKDYAVLITAEVQESPPAITLNWSLENNGIYFVYKKMKEDKFFGSSFETLPANATTYTDSSVEVGKSYEYYIKRNGSPPAYGYINAGIKVEPEENGTGVKGKLMLLIDSTHLSALQTEIERLVADLEGEGWTVLSKTVSPDTSVVYVKSLVTDEYASSGDDLKAIYLLGHIPVPYSGNLAPDAHPDHVGAWPTDAFYADMDGVWTDVSINNVSANDPRNRNIPGDGKYDHSIIPSDVELQVGRVDFYNMPAFADSETELLRKYLNKNHAFRTAQIKVTHRAIIDDNFGGFNNEAFAASGWKAFTTFFGPDSITFANSGTTADYRTNLNTASYLWSYGCGGGSYTSCSGIGNTSQIAGDSLQSVFTLLFGSYFGDWDKANNFLRAPLAQGLTLTNAWSGRPHWYLHHMALGDNIGYDQNLMVNSNAYFQHYAARGVHIALMGDPTLRMYAVEPPSNFQLTENNNKVDLSWTASPDNVLGYYVFRKDSVNGLYHKVSQSMVNGTNFTDAEFDRNGKYYYSVRAVKLEESASGTFYNLSTGVIGEIETIYTGLGDELSHMEMLEVYPNPAQDVLYVKAGISEQVMIRITSLDGRMLNQYTSSKSGSLELDISELSSGVYFLTVESAMGIATKRWIKM